MSTQQQETTRETVVPLTSEYPIARVDLLPPEILERRNFRKAQAWMVVGLVTVLAAAGGVWYLAAADVATAQEELDVERARSVALQAEAAEYAEIPVLLATIDRAEAALDTAMAADVEWYRYLSQIGQSAPAGVWFSAIDITALEPGAMAADPLAPPDAVGEIITTGRALTYPDVATWLDAFDGVSNLDHVLFADATLDRETGSEPWVDFTASTKVAPEAYSNRYVQGEQ